MKKILALVVITILSISLYTRGFESSLDNDNSMLSNSDFEKNDSLGMNNEGDSIKWYFENSPYGLLLEYKFATEERREQIDSIMADYENFYRKNQVKSICGVEFGWSYDKVLPILRNKFGKETTYSDAKKIHFKNIKYGGLDFDDVYFMFQSDGYQSYFNICIFVNDAKDQDAVEELLISRCKKLWQRYPSAYEFSDEFKEKSFIGGTSPLWDGKWTSIVSNAFNLESNLTSAVKVDVIEYSDDLVKNFGNKYGVRIIYGPYEFVKEEF